MYSVFLPFACLILDLITAYVYLDNEFWVSGLSTGLIALVPLMASATLLFFEFSTVQQATIFLGFTHSGPQLILQLTLLTRYWNHLEGVLISYGTLDSPVYTILVISCLSSSLVLAKCSRECHFICQAPNKPLRVSASYFRASPYFLLHILFRGLSLGLILSAVPVWLALVFLAVIFISNLVQFILAVKLPLLQALVSSFTSMLTPAVFPGHTNLSFPTLKKFQIINCISVTVVLLLSAILSQIFFGRTLCPKDPVPPYISYSITSTTEVPSLPQRMKCFNHWSLQYGFVPHITIAGCLYVFMIVIVMGVLEPAWLRLPTHQDSFESFPEKRAAPAYSAIQEEKSHHDLQNITFERFSISKETKI